LADAPAASHRGRLRRLLGILPPLLGLFLLCGAIFVVQREFRHLRIADIKLALEGISNRSLGISLLFTVAAYGVLTFYDRLGTIYAGHPVSYRRVAFASFCAYTLSHNLGFPAVSGAAVRYRLYAIWGLSPVEIAKVVAFCSLTFGLGGLVLGGAVLFLEEAAVPFFGDLLPPWVMYAIAATMWAIAGGYIMLSRLVGRIRVFGHTTQLPSWRMAILQVSLATVDVAITAAIFYTLLPAAPGLTFPRFMTIYLASYTAGLAANLPGGIGVFDSAMLLGLADYVDAPVVVGAILVFRLYYYIIPLFIAGGLFTGNEILLRGGLMLKRRGRGSAAKSLAKWSEPDFAIGAATGVVVLCGALLLLVSVVAPQPDLGWIDPEFVDLDRTAGPFIASLIGAGLMVLAAGLAQRVTLAWGSTIFLLLFGALYNTAQGQPDWITVVLVLSAIMIAPFRRAFYRHAHVLRGALHPANVVPLVALAVCAFTLALFDRHVGGLEDSSWWSVVLSPDFPNSLRVTLAVVVLVGIVALWRLIRPDRVVALPWGPEAAKRYAKLGGTPPIEADGLVLGEAERSAIAYRRMNGMLLGLGDPTGADADRASAIWRLRDLARQEGLDPAVWRAGHSLLKVYLDLGLTPLPLGEDLLPEAADPRSPPRGGYLCCMAERDLDRLLPVLRTLAKAARPVRA
jgi:uncharacterized membrane protein YbhN (UPF0104 family)